MDSSDIFNRGDSIPRTVMLYNEDTDAPMDLDLLTDIQFEVLHTVTNRVLRTLTLSGGTVTKQDAANGLAWFNLGQQSGGIICCVLQAGKRMRILRVEYT